MRPDRAGLADRGPDRQQQSRQFGQGDVVGLFDVESKLPVPLHGGVGYGSDSGPDGSA